MLKNVFYRMRKSKKNIIFVGVCCLLLIGVILIPFSLAELTPIKSVNIYSEKSSYSSNKPGAWKIEKSGKWISKGTAEVTFKIDTKSMMKSVGADIYLVFDTSGSMEGSRLNKVKSDSISLINDLFASGDGNKVGLIRFSNDSQILTDLTTSKSQLASYINGLSANGETNYYSAFVDVGNLVKNYQKQDNRDCIVLFLTDGLPNINTPNEVVQYNYLKSEYPWLIINGIQYEMGNTILDPIKKVTDNQFVAKEETLNEALEEASVEKLDYEKFSVTDYIDTRYFKVESKNNIMVNNGEITLDEENQKIIWNLTGLRSGIVLESSKPKMTIKAKLKNELIGKGGVYPTNSHEEIISKIETQEENVNSTLTPILADNYKVKYDGNAPSGCSISGVPADENHSVFDTVDISDSSPICKGYKFKGWRVVDSDIEKIGSNRFIMPEKDVEVKAMWGKVRLKKSMDGKMIKVQNIYEMMRDNSRGDDQNLSFSSRNIDTTSGVYQYYETKSDKYPVYYYRGEVNNNIKYANMCWKIVRTTETGGAKLVYNGLPAGDGSCNNTGSAATIGNSYFNSSRNSPAYVGYKYGKTYTYNYKSSPTWYSLIGKSGLWSGPITSSNYYYGDGVTYQGGKYTLNNAKQYYWSDNYSKLSHYYTCTSSSNGTCTKVWFILSSSKEDGGSSLGPSSSSFHFVEMSNGETYESLYSEAEAVIWKYGYDVIYNTNTNSYTLTGSIGVGVLAYYSNTNERNKVANAHHYTCFNNSDECSESVNYIYDASSEPYYITLSGGTNIEKALKEMTSESTNENKSTILTTIDTWYENNLKDTEFEDHIEDTVWCNDRSTSSLGGWSKYANSGGALYFGAYGRNESSPYRPSLKCVNEVDRFSTTNEKAKLDYPVGLLTADEATLAGSGRSSYSNKSYLYTGSAQWLLSPYIFRDSALGSGVDYSGRLFNNYVKTLESSGYGVRPSVSLEPGAIISGGDGSGDSPFEIAYGGV